MKELIGKVTHDGLRVETCDKTCDRWTQDNGYASEARCPRLMWWGYYQDTFANRGRAQVQCMEYEEAVAWEMME